MTATSSTAPVPTKIHVYVETRGLSTPREVGSVLGAVADIHAACVATAFSVNVFGIFRRHGTDLEYLMEPPIPLEPGEWLEPAPKLLVQQIHIGSIDLVLQQVTDSIQHWWMVPFFVYHSLNRGSGLIEKLGLFPSRFMAERKKNRRSVLEDEQAILELEKNIEAMKKGARAVDSIRSHHAIKLDVLDQNDNYIAMPDGFSELIDAALADDPDENDDTDEYED